MQESILELIQFTLPALIVFGTVYYLFKGYLDRMYHIELLKSKREQSKDILAVRLQAYERLVMFCERISVENLVYRLYSPDLGVKELKTSIIIAVQQEYDHNLTQQIYVSENLWKIIILAKEKTVDTISTTNGNTPAELITNVKQVFEIEKMDPIGYAKKAISNEASLFFK